MELFWGVVVVSVVIAIFVSMAQSKALAAAQAAYETALAELSTEPHNNDRRITALNAGRHYAQLARAKAGSKGVAIFR